MSTPTATPAPTDLELAELAAAALDAALNSASVELIGVVHWWDRATSALITAAANGHSWQRVVATLARKLQISTYREADAKALVELGKQLDRTDSLSRWAYIAQYDAPYIIAMCRIERTARRERRCAS